MEAAAILSRPAVPGARGPPAENPAPWQDYQTVFTNAKAGMDGVDKEHVQRVVYEMSKDSAHFRNERRKQAAVNAKIERLKERSAALTAGELAAAIRSVDGRIASLEASRDLTRTWLHADMDCFYAAVHEAERPELKKLPMAVGDMGMISTANYLARKYGVRSAMPGFIAKRLCPQLVFVHPDFSKYTAVAEQVRAVFRQLDPDFESGGLDEAYLDVTDYCARTGSSGEQAAAELRRRVRESCGLTCSCGVAPNKMLAKICSDINKPDGQYVLPPRRAAILSFLETLPTRKIPCIGKVTEQLLRGVLGVATCGQLLGPQRGRLPLLFSETAAGFFLEAALGLAPSRHPPKTDSNLDPGRKGISCERTFRNMSAPAAQEAMAKQLVESLAADMAAEELEGRNLTLKLKLSTFEVRTRAAALPRHVRTAADMLPHVLRLLRAEMPVELRLMGVRMAGLRKINSAVRSPLARLLGLRPLRREGSAPPLGASDAAAAAPGATATAATSPEPGKGNDGAGPAPPAHAAFTNGGGGAADPADTAAGSIAAAAAISGAAGSRWPSTTLSCTTPNRTASDGAASPEAVTPRGGDAGCGGGGVLPNDPWAYDMDEREDCGIDEQWDEQDEEGDEEPIREALEEEDALYGDDQDLYGIVGLYGLPAPNDPSHQRQPPPPPQQQQQQQEHLQAAYPGQGDGDMEQGVDRPHLLNHADPDPDEQQRAPKRQRPGTHSAADAATGPMAANGAVASAAEPPGGGLDGEVAAEPAAKVGGAGGGGTSGSTGGAWTCRVCTFAHNRRQLLRCEVCDCLRGSTQPPPAIPPPPQRGGQHQHPHHPRKGGRAEGAVGVPPTGGGAGSRKGESSSAVVPRGAGDRRTGQPEQQPLLLRLWGSTAATAPKAPTTAPAVASSSSAVGKEEKDPGGQRQALRETGVAGGSSAGAQRWGEQQRGVQAGQQRAGADREGRRDQSQWCCPQCGKTVCAARWVEHQDWHLAVRLSRGSKA